jgi:hypothetical protein
MDSKEEIEMFKNFFNKKENLERKEVKEMRKKITVFLGVFLVLMLMTGASAHALVVQGPEYRFHFDDYDIFDDPVPDINPLFGVPVVCPGCISSGATWGIADLTLAQKKDPITGIWKTYWTRGQDGKYYHAVIGGLAITPDPASPIGFRKVTHGAIHLPDVIPPGEYVVPPPYSYPHNAYMTDLTGGLGYLKLYEHTTDNWVQAVSEGPNILGMGALGTFGKTILWGPDMIPGTADDPTLVVDAVFNPWALGVGTNPTPGLPNPTGSGDLDAAFPGSPSGLPPSLFRSVSNTSTQVGLIGWGDVTGGKWMNDMDTNTLYGGSDFRISADVYYLYDPITNVWNPVAGWPSYSVGQIQGVPEPGTILLLGAGLLGVGFFMRRKKK